MKTILIPALIAIAFNVASCNEEKNTQSTDITTEQIETKKDSTNTANDATFAVTAAEGSFLEVKLGILAQANGTATKIKELGKMMENDHSKASDELIVWAMKHGVILPTEMSTEKQEKYNSFTSKKGVAFDKAYAAFMVEDHEKDIQAFKKQADEGGNSELKSWAAGKLPLLEHHLEMAKTTNAMVNK